jgi:hypothetical protein
VQPPEFRELVDDAVDGRRRAAALGTELIGDLLGAQQALPFTGKQLDDDGACPEHSAIWE